MSCGRIFVLAVALIALLSATLIKSSAVAQNRYIGSTITGTAYFVGGRTRARTLPFKLFVNRLTTTDEVNQLNSALQSGGQDELLKVLSKMEAGRIQIGTGVGLDANAIIATETEGRTKLVVVYERNIRFGELRYGARSQDYRFGYSELYVGRGADEGMLIPAARIRLRDGNTWEVEDFGTYPARLLGLQVHGGRETVR